MHDEGKGPGSRTRIRYEPARQEFRPVEIETTRDLDLTGLNDEEARSLRQRVLDVRQDDAVIANALGLPVEQAFFWPTFIRWMWGRWGQFPQTIYPLRAADEDKTPQETLKETVTRLYNVDNAPRPGDERGGKGSERGR